jgi:hypothetical protein
MILRVYMYLLLTECKVCTVRKLWTEDIPPGRLMAQWTIKKWQKRGTITYGTDRANEVNKMFLIWQFSN